MNKELRNQLRSTIVQCRTLLERAISEMLQGEFGIHLTGLIEPTDRMTHLPTHDMQYREQVLIHLEHLQSFGLKSKDAINQLVREASFTHLNRLCAYKMMEKRELIKETVSRGLKSKGFLFYLADHSEDEKLWSGGEQDLAYRHFFESLGATLSAEIGVLFSPQDLANRLFPPFRVLDRVLSLINTPELEDVWVEDEAIGWVYQYFTPKELRDQARKESQAPRNSYELAFRNQFFTPRYVVEFLADNTLGRMWYEMRQGETVLAEKCRYLARQPNEIFLSPNEEPPKEGEQAAESLSEVEVLKRPVYVKHRAKKDPREIKVLDPACGSGHFLLYCFDLLQTIYEESYCDEELGVRLKEDYPALDDLRKAVPGLILAHNLHGVDIDLRATQIAGLALWLRCQRAYKELGLKAGDRPLITRTNIVCAEPMPGEKELLEEFVEGLQPRLLGQLVRVVFEKMKLAGEAGSLLKIEEEISGAIAEAKTLWRSVPKKEQMALFQREKLPDNAQAALFDVTGITDEQFWHEAEGRVVEALRKYAQTVATNGQGLLRQLFADDAAHGFAFVDICRKRFDVVLMNPPFGDVTPKTSNYLISHYAEHSNNILCSFVLRGLSLLSDDGCVGAITDKTALVKSSYSDFRKQILSGLRRLTLMADLGWGVLDEAQVETAAFKIERRTLNLSIFLRTGKSELLTLVNELKSGLASKDIFLRATSLFSHIPNSSIAYDLPSDLLAVFLQTQRVEPDLGVVRQGLGISDSWRWYRHYAEIPNSTIGRGKSYVFLANGGEFSPFYRDLDLLIYWNSNGAAIKAEEASIYESWSRTVKNVSYYFVHGISFPKRTDFLNAHILPSDCIFTVEGLGFFTKDQEVWNALDLLNSRLYSYLINTYCGQHKHVGYIKQLPFVKQDSNGISSRGYFLKRHWATAISGSPLFVSPALLSLEYLKDKLRAPDKDEVGRNSSEGINNVESLSVTLAELVALRDQYGKTLDKIQERIDASVFDNYNISTETRKLIVEGTARRDSLSPLQGISNVADIDSSFWIRDLVAYFLGCVFGIWDVRYSTGERCVPELPDPFAPLPVSAPGALTGAEGLPLRKAPPGYALRIDWDGILVDDPDHDEDIIRRVREVFELLWQKRAEVIEREACTLLGVKTLRDYFSKASAGGFWTDHVKRYSKSRRKAPIYWFLRSSKGNYAIWLYYHRLDKDILYKALLNYVEPKLRLEENNLSQLRQRRETVGTTGREAKQLEKDLDKQESFISELYDFHGKLKRAADLHLEPDLNDGVVLNIAPLWELVPWIEAKKYWKELTEGKYEWSTISKQLRERGLIKDYQG
jgi:hypothetical protein